MYNSEEAKHNFFITARLLGIRNGKQER
jgi:hypothetical protein